MAREHGVIGISGAFEPQTAMPLDARMIIPTKAELILDATWAANDSNKYAYKGMLVSVHGDAEANNGIYQLKELPYSTASNWLKVSGGGSSVETSIIQSNHGFSVLTPVYFDIDTTLWTKARADSFDTVATHVVSRIVSTDEFVVCQVGEITVTAHGKALGYWFTSDLVAGETTDTSPLISNPVFFVQDINTIYVLNFRTLDGSAPEDTTIVHDDISNTFLQIQQYNGNKTFTLDNQIIAKKYVDDIAILKADDLDVVHNTGNESISGIKTFNDYTKLGSDAPVIKMLKLTGTTASTQAGSTTVSYGSIAGAKIISWTCEVRHTDNESMPPDYTYIAGYEYKVYKGNGAFTVTTSDANSTNILSKPVVITIFYEE